MSLVSSGGRVRVEGHVVRLLDDGWEAAAVPADSCPESAELAQLTWRPARVPGTAAATLFDAGAWRPGHPRDFDAEDWWFRTRFEAAPGAADEEVVLGLDGIATVADVYLNGELVLQIESMFAAHALDVGARLREGINELAIRCRALGPLLRVRRRPRARWRTRVVADGNLRFFRTTMLGRAPGFAPGPAAVGPWRPVRIERRRGLAVDELELRPRVAGAQGVLGVSARMRALDRAALSSAEIELSGPSGTHRAPLALQRVRAGEGEGVLARGELVVPEVARWWPHTHGEPVLHDVRLLLAREPGHVAIAAGRVGFRTLAAGAGAGHDTLRDGLDLHLNGVQVFARGAVWTPADPISLAPAAATLREALQAVRDAGMNMLRIPGIGTYESHDFHDLCDELGILVWQDFMFANLDYPIADAHFRALVEDEARTVLASVAGRPSLAVLCGNSEVEQQVAMLGLDPALGRGELFGEILPTLVRAADVDAVYLPSAPCGGDLPFRPDRGVANYFGVGGYRRPLEDARRAEVRFASECLALSNVPDEEALAAVMLEAPADPVSHHPRWKAGVPRDAGSGWDFEDVRDHYFKLLFGIDGAQLRRYDHARYLELSRAVSGELMAEVFGEWRRAGSPCGGALVLWLRDLAPGAGWGLLDHRGEPKVAYHHLRRALAPVAVWTTDEGLGGVVVHAVNEGPSALRAHLRVSLYRDLEHKVDEAQETVELAPHAHCERNVEALLGRFVDAAWAYRFGPPGHDLIVASLEQDGELGTQLLSQSFRFPAARPTETEPAGRLGLRVSARALADGEGHVAVRTRRLAYGVRLHAPGFVAADDAFSVEPGGERTVVLRPRAGAADLSDGTLTALNLQGQTPFASEPGPG